MYRSQSCGSTSLDDLNKEVVLSGWVHRRRDHGGLIFIDLRDVEGLVQVVFDQDTSFEAYNLAQSFRNEWVVQVSGVVFKRPVGTENSDLGTGDVEVHASDAKVLNQSLTPPFYVNEEGDVDENLRLKFRYIDIRRSRMKNALIQRHKIVKYIRDFLADKGFIEVETPILIKSTPEGARDHIVPSRLYPGMFYALPQSPQQLKQLLMVAGLDKYFQIARCFRDEDSRLDRQPEFTQLDLEMSFVTKDDVLSLTEELFTTLVSRHFPDKIVKTPFPRLTFEETLREYGTDRPDMRFDMKLIEVSDVAKKMDFRVFQKVIESDGSIKGITAVGCSDYTRGEIDDLTDLVKSMGANGLIAIGLEGSGGSVKDVDMTSVKSNISRFLTPELVKSFATKMNASYGDLMLIIAGGDRSTNDALSALRQEMAQRNDLINPDILAFAFVEDFPLFEWDNNESKWDASHHAFCMPKEGYREYLYSDPGKVIAESYDLVCNGYEVASGSISVHHRSLQEQIFRVLGFSDDQMDERFSQLLNALEYGAPPHGGIAPGIDRIAMILLGRESIRDVIAFPKTQSQIDPLFEAPSAVEAAQLEELGIRIVE